MNLVLDKKLPEDEYFDLTKALRLLAALAVIYGHSYAIVLSGGQEWLTRVTGSIFSGGVAVDFFFVLSGYLVSGSIKRRGVVSYALARGLRLVPGLWFSIAILVFVICPFITTRTVSDYFHDKQTWDYTLSIATMREAAYFLPGVFEGNRTSAVNGSIWSIIIEVRMYIYLAVIYCLGLMRSKVIFNVFAFIAVLAVWSGSVVLPGVSGPTDKHVASLFAAGVFVYMNKDRFSVGPVFMLGAIILTAVTIGTDRFLYAYSLLLIGIFWVLINLKTFKTKFRFGDYSYGVYLWGWPIQQLVAHAFPALNATTNAMLSMMIVLILAIFSWHLVENPVIQLKSPYKTWMASKQQSFKDWRSKSVR